MILDWFDRYESNLSAGCTAGGSSLSVASASGLPSGASYFFAIVKAEGANTEELFLVTNVSGTTLTVIGAQGGTSASNHASGATIIAPIMTANAFRRTTDIFSAAKDGGTLGSEVHKNASVSNGATQTLLTQVNASGYVSEVGIWSDKYSVEVIITVDGEGTPSIDCNLADLLGDNYLDTQPAFSGRWITASNNGSGKPGGVFRLPIPFASSVKIELKNNSGGTAVITSMISYRTGIANEWAYTQRLKVAVVSASGIAADAETTMLDVTPNKRGRLAGFGWIYDGFPGSATPRTAPLEGAFKIYIDSPSPLVASYTSSGSEDMFGMGWYFLRFNSFGTASTNFLQNANPDIVLTQWNSNGYGAQRFFIHDPIVFRTAIKLTWTNGNTSQVAFTGTSTMKTTVYYYVEN